MDVHEEQSRKIKTAAQREEDKFLGVKQAADLLHLSDASIRRYLSNGKLKRYKVGVGPGARTLLDRDQVLSLIREA